MTLCPDYFKILMAAADEDPNKVGEALHGMLEAKVYVYGLGSSSVWMAKN